MTNSLSGGHSEKEKEHKERIRKLKAKTSKMRIAISTFKPSTSPPKRVPMDKEQKKQRRQMRDSIRKTEASNEEVRLKFNQKFYPGGGGAKHTPSILPPKRKYTRRAKKKSIGMIGSPSAGFKKYYNDKDFDKAASKALKDHQKDLEKLSTSKR